MSFGNRLSSRVNVWKSETMVTYGQEGWLVGTKNQNLQFQTDIVYLSIVRVPRFKWPEPPDTESTLE